MHPFASFRAFVAIALTMSLIGCGGVALGPHAVVHGTAKLDGAALADAEIRFVPKGNNPDLGTAQAKTDATGAFKIAPDANKNNLLKPGKYVVLISKVVQTKADGAMGTPTVNMVPANYSLQAKSPLVADLKEGENKLAVFELTSDKKLK